MEQQYKRNQLAWAVLSALALGLSACSSGGGSSSAPPLQIGGGSGSGGTPTTAPTPAPTPAPTTTPTTVPGPVNAQPPMDAHLKLIGADQALAAGYKGAGVTIGIVDTGVRRDHPTLNGRVVANYVHVGSSNDLSVDDKSGHGTTVAQLAAGSAVGDWPGGVAQAAKIASSRIIADARPDDDGSGQGNEVTPGGGIDTFFRMVNLELADAGARILNNSWGGLYWNSDAVTSEFITAYSDFILNRDGLVVFANGNNGTDARYRDNPSHNAALPSKSAAAAFLERGWLTVAALNPTEASPTLTDYSQACGIAMNYCLAAPGNVVYTGLNDSAGNPTYYWGGGTSFAAPLVSGAAALVWSAFPYFNNDLVRQTILGTATDIGAEGVDEVFGHGLLNVAKAVKGPARFDWGDVDATLPSGSHSVWGNAITGDGGLNKYGGGTLVLSEYSEYTGETHVAFSSRLTDAFNPASDEISTLIARKGLGTARLEVHGTGVAWAMGSQGADVVNTGGLLFAGSAEADAALNVGGNYLQNGGVLAFWLGNPLGVAGTATIEGDAALHVQGIRDGYVAQSKETVIHAQAGMQGKFASLSWNPRLVLLSAELQYDSFNTYLHTQRVDVNTVANLGQFTGTALDTAQRVERAMQRIDQQLASPLGGPASTAFMNSLGAFQRAQGIDGVSLSLRSLSGQLHGISSALTHDSIDAARRAASGRFDALAQGRLQAGSWYSDMSRNGTLAQAGFDGVGHASSGEMIGHDVRIGHNAVLGLALGRQQQQSWLPLLGDEMRGYQSEGQLYAGWVRAGGYVQGRLGFGQFNRQMQRNLLLGNQLEGVHAQLSGNYLNLNAEAGYRLGVAGFALTPYAGVQHVDLHNRAFQEAGAGGLGLRAQDHDSRRTQGYFGLRSERSWQLLNGLRLALDARGEWLHTLDANGEIFNASFVGLEDWQPLYGPSLGARSRVFGLGLGLGNSRHLLRLDYSRRRSELGDVGSASLQYRRGF